MVSQLKFIDIGAEVEKVMDANVILYRQEIFVGV